MRETDAEFVERISRAIYDRNSTHKDADLIRLFDLARRGAEATARIAQLEAEGDKARARGDRMRMALEDVAYGNPLHNEDDLMRIARAALEASDDK